MYQVYLLKGVYCEYVCGVLCVNYYLIDYENIQLEGIKDLKGVQEGDAIIVFYSENCKSTSLDVLDNIMTLKIVYSSFKVKVGTKNALDFQLITYLGYLIGKGDENTNYFIVSNDKGFEAVSNFWKEHDISVNRISKKEHIAEDLATLDEIKALIGKHNDPDEVLKIFNKYKSKKDICDSLSKHFRDSKRVGEIYKNLKPLIKSKNKS